MAKLSKQENPTGNDDMYQEALGMDAAGGHFLTDAFASGHLMDSTKVQAAIQNYLLTNPIRTKNPEMQTVVAGVQAAGLAVSLTLKNIHDRMNAEGFEVTNAQGMKWRTYGDNHLKNAVETQRVAAYAVFVSRQQINQARNGELPDPNEVLALLPDATTVDRWNGESDFLHSASCERYFIADKSQHWNAGYVQAAIVLRRAVTTVCGKIFPWYNLGPWPPEDIR